jgi:uncharacterized BrkB/YihY/UPF0761 family membrane protein
MSDPPPTGTEGKSRLDARTRSARAAAERGVERAREVRGVPVALKSLTHEQRSGASLLAGGLAYRFFFWLVPAGLVVAATASFWARSSEGSLEDAAKSFGLSGIAARSAVSAVEDGSKARWYFLGAGLIFVAYFGLGAVRALRVASFIAWRIEPQRLRGPLRASASFTGIFVLGVAVSLSASWLRQHSPAIGLVATVAGVIAYMLLALWAFEHLPHPAGTTWRTFLPGALLLGWGITVMHVVIAYYLAPKLERSPKLYGALGASTVVLLGLFMIARLVVSAMFLNATVDRDRQADLSRPQG